MTRFLFLLWMINGSTTAAFGASAPALTFKFEKTSVAFYNYPELHLTMSKPCVKKPGIATCEGLEFLDHLSVKEIRSDLRGGMNPGAAICTKQVRGVVVVGVSQAASGGENSFCRVSGAKGTTDLFIDSGTLKYYASKNDHNRQSGRTQ